MLSVSSLIEFLLSLLRDDDALAEFEQDPEGVLARNGLDGVTAQDVRDVAPLLADRDGVSFRHGSECDDDRDNGDRGDDDGARGGGHHRVDSTPDRLAHRSEDHRGWSDHGSHGAPASRHQYDDDPVREIHHVTHTYHADPQVTVQHNVYNEYTYVDNRVIDDRDVTGDGNTVTHDSYNQDNDGVDNKGGAITDSVVGGNDVADSGNDNDGVDNDGAIRDSFDERTVVLDDDTTIVESYNDNSTATATEVRVEDSFTSDDDVLDIDVTGRNAAEDPYNTGSSGVADDAAPAADTSAA